MTTGQDPSQRRQAFRDAAQFFGEVVARIPDGQWDAPGLGVWSIRELVSHTNRTMLAIERYAAEPAAPVEVSSAAEYYRLALAPPDIHARIAEGGTRAAEALSGHPADLVKGTVQRVTALVESLPDTHPMQTQVGVMRLDDYLRTRVLELTVHTLDVCRSAGLTAAAPPSALRQTLYLIVELAVDRGAGAELTMAATGRGPLPSQFSVVA